MGHHTVAKSAAQNAKKWGIAAVLTGGFTVLILASVIVILIYGGPYSICKCGKEAPKFVSESLCMLFGQEMANSC